ncbi:MAG: SpoIIE family protein phosphatase [Acidobacteriota bacterium]|nr:MAG: SpoIIE family protein phosphatase [Acidobacteriota bacterium]
MTNEAQASPIGYEALKQVLDITRKLATPFDLQTMLEEVIAAGRQVLHADRGTVFLYEPDTDELVVKAADGFDAVRMSARTGITGECIQTRSVINVPEAYSDTRFNRSFDARTGYRTKSLLTMPLIGYDGALVGVLQLLNKQGGAFDEHDERVGVVLAAQCAVALQRVRMTEQIIVKERMDRELAVARQIQLGTLPARMPELEDYEFAGLTLPAEETGGDTFDIVSLDDERVMLLIGDATGHGVGPAICATQMRSMLRVALRLGAGLDHAFAQIDEQLACDLPDERFVTAFLGLLNAREHTIQYHAAGQAPLLVYRAAMNDCEWFGSTTLPMGVMPGLPRPNSETIVLGPGDILALITDGVYEYHNGSQQMFGEPRVAEVFRRHHAESLSDLSSRLLESVRAFGGDAPQLDDITMVLVRRSRSG